MSRASVGSGLAAKLAGAVTTPGYLVEIQFDTPVYWSSVGSFTWDSQAWTQYDFRVGLSDSRLTLNFKNHDNVMGATVLADGVSNRVVKLWKYEGVSPGATDVVQIFEGLGDTYALNPREVAIRCIPAGYEVIKEPNLRILRNSVRQEITPAGTRVPWNGEIFILEN